MTDLTFRSQARCSVPGAKPIRENAVNPEVFG